MIKLTYEDGTDYVLQFGRYPDGTFYLPYEPDSLKLGTVKNITMTKPTAEEVYKLVMFLDAKNIHNEALNSRIPYSLFFPMMPGGRQDKIVVKEGVDFLTTLKSTIRLIAKNLPSGSKMYTVDRHSEATSNNGSWIVNSIPIVDAIGDKIEELRNDEYDVVIAPDKGAEERARSVADTLDIPLLTLKKHRDLATGMILRYSGFDIGRTKALVVDDICDGGATFNMLAKSGNPEADLNLFVTFGIFSKGSEALLRNYNKIYTTDLSGYDTPDGIIILEVLDRMIKEIAAK